VTYDAHTKVGRSPDGTRTEPGRQPYGPHTDSGSQEPEILHALFVYGAATLRFMGKNRSGLGAVLRDIARGPERSSLFYWLYDSHDEIVQASLGRRIRWKPIAEHAGKLGLTDGDDKPPTAERVRQTWFGVRQEVAKQRALRASGLRPSLSLRAKRPPADWQPSSFTHPHAPLPTGSEHQGSQTAALAAVPPQQRPGLSPSAGTHQDSDQPAPGSIEAARQKANLRSSLRANGDPLHKR